MFGMNVQHSAGRVLLFVLFSLTLGATARAQSCPSPEIVLSATEACPYAMQSATVAAPVDGSWMSISWSITGGGGQFRLNEPPWYATYASGSTVEFTSDGSGPVTLQAVATHSSGCTAAPVFATATVRANPDPPVITVSTPDICL